MRTFIIKIFLVIFLSFSAQVNSQNLLNGPDDLVFDLKYNRILVGNWAGNRIIAIDSNGNQSIYKTGLTYCHGMELYGDTLYVTSANVIYLININNAQTIRYITVPGSSRLGSITLDTINYILYISDWSVEKIFKVNLNTNSSSILLNSGYGIPAGILFDGCNDRLILNTFNTTYVPIKAVNITTGQVTNLTSPIYYNLAAVTRDKNGFIYFTSFETDAVYKIDSSFASPHQIISTGHNDPSGLGYNRFTHTLGVTNYNTNSISLITLPGTRIGKSDSNSIKEYILHQNYPNPFNPTTFISFNLKKSVNIKLNIYDIAGKLLMTIINKKLSAGRHEIKWDATDYSSGIYFYRLESDNYSETGKMIFLK